MSGFFNFIYSDLSPSLSVSLRLILSLPERESYKVLLRRVPIHIRSRQTSTGRTAMQFRVYNSDRTLVCTLYTKVYGLRRILYTNAPSARHVTVSFSIGLFAEHKSYHYARRRSGNSAPSLSNLI